MLLLKNVPFWSAKTKIIVSGGAICLCVGISTVYYFWKKRLHKRKMDEDPVLCITLLKEDGIKYFKQKNYFRAIEIFKEAVALIKSLLEDFNQNLDTKAKGNLSELLTNCYNNIAASFDCLDNFDECINYCTQAISINPTYLKALNRRARSLFKVKNYRDALADYLDIASNTPASDTSKMQTITSDIDQVADAMISFELEDLLKEMVNKKKPIAQHLIASWLWSTVFLDLTCSYEGLRDALLRIKKPTYDEVFDLAIFVLNDENQPILERIKSLLLSARFAFYHNMKTTGNELVQRFSQMWESLDPEIRDQNKELFIAYSTLYVTFSSAPVSQLIQTAEHALTIESKNSDPFIALANRLLEEQNDSLALELFARVQKIDPQHPHAKFYELYSSFLISLSEHNIGRIHDIIAKLENAIDSSKKPPIFAMVLMTKIGMLLQSNSLAIQYAKKAINCMPNCAYALYLYGLLNEQADGINPENIANYLKRAEKIMKKVIEIDPNYWEPYRMLAKFCVDRQEFDSASRYYSKSIELASTKEELQVLLKEKLMAKILEEQKSRGRVISISSQT